MLEKKIAHKLKISSKNYSQIYIINITISMVAFKYSCANIYTTLITRNWVIATILTVGLPKHFQDGSIIIVITLCIWNTYLLTYKLLLDILIKISGGFDINSS